MVRQQGWDFRPEEEKEISKEFEDKGFVVLKGKREALDQLKSKVICVVESFCRDQYNNSKDIELERVSDIVRAKDINKLRLVVMRELSKDVENNKLYFDACKEIVNVLCGNELVMQKRISLSVQCPGSEDDKLPIHADTWNGVSEYDLNIWIPLVDCRNDMCLYIMDRELFRVSLEKKERVLERDADDAFEKLRDRLTFVEVDYGDILAFDQSLPHGYAVNTQVNAQWSMNCRFKSFHSPYRDKQLGEYFMPITVRSTTRLGLNYRPPSEWLSR